MCQPLAICGAQTGHLSLTLTLFKILYNLSINMFYLELQLLCFIYMKIFMFLLLIFVIYVLRILTICYG